MIIYTLIFCTAQPCLADDSFSIKIREAEENSFREIYKNGTANGRTREDRWTKETIYFRTTSSAIFVSKQ
jgi:hypothetical protein